MSFDQAQAPGRDIQINFPFQQWYHKFFSDRVIILTGCGRSGTSVMGRLMASFRPMYYFFEPTTPKALIGIPDLARTIMFEEHVLPVAQGRNINPDPGTESFYGYYISERELKWRWENKTRINLLPRIMKENAPIVIKLTEMPTVMPQADVMFPRCRLVHIIRNGNDVIQSMMRPGWYNDTYMAVNSVDWVETRTDVESGTVYNIPHFVSVVDGEAADNWFKYNHATRCAVAWRCATSPITGSKDETVLLVIKYEDLCDNPSAVVDKLLTFYKARNDKVIKTDSTNGYIENIKGFKVTQYPDITDQIEEPERQKFLALMEKLGYR